MSSRTFTQMITAALATSLLSASALAQAQVSNQVDPQAQSGGRQVDNRVNAEVYGNNYSGGSVRYPHQVLLLPSEERFAIERSGALPSEIRANSNAVGPLAPYGRASYVPNQSALQRAVGARPPQLFGPAYASQPQLTPPTPAPVASPDAPGLPKRDGDPATLSPQAPPPAELVQPRRVMIGQMIDRRVTPNLAIPDTGESIHYYRLPPRPTTQPTTQPSLSEEQRQQQQ